MMNVANSTISLNEKFPIDTTSLLLQVREATTLYTVLIRKSYHRITN